MFHARSANAERLSTIGRHLDGNIQVLGTGDFSAVRTPICKSRSGAFKNTPAEELLCAAIKGLLKRTGIDPCLVQDVVSGNVLAPGAGATLVRIASLAAGIPVTAGAMSLNRQCSSGLQAVASVAAAIRAGYIDVGIGSGFESMSQHYGPQALAVGVSPRLLSYSKDSSDCLTPMGITSEEVAERYEICRETQDQFAYESCTKASKAQKDGLFESEIVPVHLIDGDEVISRDDSIREGVTLEQLRKLKPAFKPDGSTTAGNASKVCDGASAVLLMKRSVAIANNLKVRARLISFVVVGVPPGVMGIGPAFAIPKALEAARVQKEDISVFEINEAFASQAAYCAKELGIDRTRLNPRGGAIAFGHPLGCTGARQIATLLPQLKVTSPIKGRRLGVVSMCVGTGMGAACVVESEEC